MRHIVRMEYTVLKKKEVVWSWEVKSIAPTQERGPHSACYLLIQADYSSSQGQSELSE